MDDASAVALYGSLHAGSIRGLDVHPSHAELLELRAAADDVADAFDVLDEAVPAYPFELFNDKEEPAVTPSPSSLDRLHPWALGGATRTALARQPGLLDELRGQVEAATT